jgi:ABC-type multidrug transport system fused ATPase/permease subunit
MVTRQTLPAVRAALSICPQDRQLLPFSIWENLRLVAESDEKLLAVARSFRLDSMVAELPGGWDTPVGELSGGQQQRVALVRAFLKTAAVVLLDEPTAHLDAANESVMLDCIRAVRAGRTVLMITHRVVNLAAVDRILVMSRGTVVEEGTFEELVDAGGLFAGFYREQLGASASVGCTERLQQD